MSTTNIGIQFIVEKYRPDNRQYKQQSLELVPLKEKLLVQVEIPVQGNFVNADMLLSAPLTGDTPPEPILNIVGLKAIIDQFEATFSDEEKVDVPWSDSDNDDWGTEESEDWGEETAGSIETPSDDDEWEEETNTPDEAWDENEESWE